MKRDCLRAIVKLIESSDTAEPGKGFDFKAAEYRSMLNNLAQSMP
jgi:hypothetical protein